MYCACALVVLTYLNTCLDSARFPSYHGQSFAGPHAQAPGDKSEETLVFPPASFVDVIEKNCGYVFLHTSMWEHIAAAVLSITVCVYGI